MAYLCKILLESAATIQAAIVVQRKFRRWKQDKRDKLEAERLGERQRRVFAMLKRSTVAMQSYARMIQARGHFRRQRGAAILLQRMTRGSAARQYLKLQMGGASKIQAMIRMHQQRSAFAKFRRAAVIVQSVARMLRARLDLKTQQIAAVRIQSVARSWIERRNFNSVRQAVVTVQSMCRTSLQRRRFRVLIRSAILIQRKIKKFLAKSRSQRVHRAAISIQSIARCMLARTKLLRACRAASLIQSAVRTYSQSVLTLNQITQTPNRYACKHTRTNFRTNATARFVFKPLRECFELDRVMRRRELLPFEYNPEFVAFLRHQTYDPNYSPLSRCNLSSELGPRDVNMPPQEMLLSCCKVQCEHTLRDLVSESQSMRQRAFRKLHGVT